MSNGRWSDSDILSLRTLWCAGKTAKEIAALMPGRSREAVLGKVHRLGLGKDSAPRQRGVKKTAPPRAAVVPIKNEINPLNISLVDLHIGKQCRWPYGEKPVRFCGHDCEGLYCVFHTARARGRQRPKQEATHETA